MNLGDDMEDLINLSDWKKQKEILYELYIEWGINITSREWRTFVEKHNKKFAEGESDFYITHSSKGFKATKDYTEAKMARNDYIKRALNMLNKAKECDKAFRQKCNYKINFEKGTIE